MTVFLFDELFWYKLRRIANVTNAIQMYNTVNKDVLYCFYCDNNKENIQYWTKEFNPLDTLGVISLLKSLSSAAKSMNLDYPVFLENQINNCETLVDLFVEELEKFIKEKNLAQITPKIELHSLDKNNFEFSYWIHYGDVVLNGRTFGGYDAMINTVKARIARANESFTEISQ